MAGAATFAFEAVDLAGVPTKGEIEAESKGQVAEQLRQRGLVVLDVSEKSSPINIEDVFRRFKGVPMRDLAVVSRQFATLVASGMPMLRALGTLEEQTEDDEISEAIDSVRRDVEAGSFAGAGDGAQAACLRPPLPGDGPLRRAVGSPRGGAGPDRHPHRENRHPAARGQIGADVPGVGLHRRDRGDGRDRRLRRPRLRRHLRRTGRRKPGGKGRTPLHDQDHASASPTRSPATGSSSFPPWRCSSTSAFRWQGTERGPGG